VGGGFRGSDELCAIPARPLKITAHGRYCFPNAISANLDGRPGGELSPIAPPDHLAFGFDKRTLFLPRQDVTFPGDPFTRHRSFQKEA